MTRVLQMTAALVAAVAVLAFATLPPARISLPDAPGDGTVAGVLHIHTNRSDGRSAPDVVAAAAARAGLKFIVITDHGDGTRVPDPPVYRSGVLCLDAVEISTDGGHYVALGMSPAPYPLAGEARDVAEDVARLGGFGMAAHPDSPKMELRWRDWGVPFDGIEIVNHDTAWRAVVQQPRWQAKARLFDALLAYPVRPAEAITSLLDHTSEAETRWDESLRLRRVVGTSGADAHAMIVSLPIPSYEASFRALSVHVRPDRALTGDAGADAAAILGGIRHGHLYNVSDGIATNPSFTFTADNGSSTAGEGDTLPAGAPVTLHVGSNAPDGFVTSIRAVTPVGPPSDAVTPTTTRELTARIDGSTAAYRVEIHANRPGAPLWLFSNPIYIGAANPVATNTHPPPTGVRSLFDEVTSIHWRTEVSPASEGTVAVTNVSPSGREMRFAYALAAAPPDSNVALVGELPDGVSPNNRFTFTARADHPMRVRVQLRTGANGLPEESWNRSVYLDTEQREQTVYFDDLRPVGKSSGTPALGDIRYVLLLADRRNNAPGSSGTIWITRAVLER